MLLYWWYGYTCHGGDGRGDNQVNCGRGRLGLVRHKLNMRMKSVPWRGMEWNGMTYSINTFDDVYSSYNVTTTTTTTRNIEKIHYIR